MTDYDAPPERRWPPLSAVAAAGLLVFPPLALLLWSVIDIGWPVLPCPLFLLLVAAIPALMVLRGERFGVILGLLGLGFLAFYIGACGVMLLSYSAAWESWPAALSVLSWFAATGFLLWWPETRRWCELLPPEADDD